MTFVWIVVAVAASIALLVLIGGLIFSNSAPQQAAVAGISLAIAGIPYVFAKSIAALEDLHDQRGRDRQ